MWKSRCHVAIDFFLAILVQNSEVGRPAWSQFMRRKMFRRDRRSPYVSSLLPSNESGQLFFRVGIVRVRNVPIKYPTYHERDENVQTAAKVSITSLFLKAFTMDKPLFYHFTTHNLKSFISHFAKFCTSNLNRKIKYRKCQNLVYN